MKRIDRRLSLAANEPVALPTWARRMIIAGLVLLIAVAIAAMIVTEAGGLP